MLLLTTAFASGCVGRSTLKEDERPTSQPVADLGQGYFDERLEAFVVPPTTWELDPPKIDDERSHLTWLSPTGDTAYGVVFFQLPRIVAFVPGGEFLHNRAADGYMEALQEETGEATLIEKQWVDEEQAMRMEAEGGPYHIRSVMRIRGLTGWSVYAGTLRDREVNEEELDLAVRAREATRVGMDAAGGAEAAEQAIAGSSEKTAENPKN